MRRAAERVRTRAALPDVDLTACSGGDPADGCPASPISCTGAGGKGLRGSPRRVHSVHSVQRRHSVREVCESGAGAIGAVFDVRYAASDGGGTWRVRVVGYIIEEGLHEVNSAGLSEWDGEPFQDVLDLCGFQQKRRLRLVSIPEGGRRAESLSATQVPALGHACDASAVDIQAAVSSRELVRPRTTVKSDASWRLK